jgi:hypothetical protein
VFRLVEGIKASERQFVDTGVTKLGSYFPVRVEAGSRCVEVSFENALAFVVVNESYDAVDSEMSRGPGRFLFTATKSSFGNFAREGTLITQLHKESYEEFVLWCEDRLIHVLSAKTPDVGV